MVSLPVKSAAMRGLLLCVTLALLAGCSMMPTMPTMPAIFGTSTPTAVGDDTSIAPLLSVEQAWSKSADECGKQAGVPEANACAALTQRGRTLQCLASQFTRSGAALGYTAPDGLDTWGHCVDEIGQTLVGGYYLRHAEIERRMLLCHANLAAAPDARKPAVLTRLRKLIGFKSEVEEEKRQHPAGFGEVLRSTPTDLQKCSTVMALAEPMQAPVAAVRAPVVPAAPVAATPLPAAPVAVVSTLEPAVEKPAAAMKPAPVVKKPVSVKKPAAKAKAS